MPSAESNAREYLGDSRLAPFLLAADEGSASAALTVLLANIETVIAEAVRRALGRSRAGAGHVEDVASEVRLHLVRRLWSIRGRLDEHEPIGDFAAYVAVVADNASDALLRRLFPNRTRFRNRVRYALNHHPGLSLTRDANGEWRCAGRHHLRAASMRGSTVAFVNDPRAWLAAAGLESSAPLPELLDRLLSTLDEPVALDRLVEALAVVFDIRDAPASSLTEERDERAAAPEPADSAASVSYVLEQRESLQQAWREITALPAPQRAALLLNLRDADGTAVIHLLPSTAVASMNDLAEALGVSRADLDALWPRLPLDDLAVGERLGLTRQQVINLRKAARARLARRLGRR